MLKSADENEQKAKREAKMADKELLAGGHLRNAFRRRLKRRRFKFNELRAALNDESSRVSRPI